MQLKTIGIGGQLNSAKDTVANYLVEKLSQKSCIPWVRNAFANKVKEVFEQAFGKTREWVEEWKRIDEPAPGFDLNVRQCLIGIGDGFRKMKASIWIERAFEKQMFHQIISDCRYINESEYIRNAGGMTILLWRKGHENTLPNASEQQLMPFVRKCLETGAEGRLSEDMEIPFNFFIRNEGSLQDLYEKLDRLIIPSVIEEWKEVFNKENLGEFDDALYFRNKILDGFKIPKQ
jgi:hypothetical protein